MGRVYENEAVITTRSSLSMALVSTGAFSVYQERKFSLVSVEHKIGRQQVINM
jgi:hypothetical protein